MKNAVILVRGHTSGASAGCRDRGLQVLPVTLLPATVIGSSSERIPTPSWANSPAPVQVAFEVDDIDVATATGWSVLVQGEAAAHDGDLDGLRLPEPWAPGDRTLIVVITATTYSGRAVSAGYSEELTRC